jgi:predicted extracellular nuclease
MMAVLLMVGMVGIQPAQPVMAANPIRISQAYGGGGNSGSTYTHDFIELFNSTDTAISLSGWSVQYASATGTTWAVTPLTGTIPANGYYLIQEAQGSGGTTPLPTPDATGSITMSGTAFKVALVNSTTSLSGACPTGVIDFVGAAANCFEGSAPAPAPSNTNAVIRKEGGCQDTDDNAADFVTGAPTPRNTASPTYACGPAETFPERFIISEYVEGSGNNQALELFNGTGAEINLQNYFMRLYSNGSTSASSTLYWVEETILPAGETYVVVNSAASVGLKNYADRTDTFTAFDGNDTLVLYEITTEGEIIRDSFGRLGYAPPNGWGSGDTSTVDHTLVRKETICQGDSITVDEFNPALEYNGFAIDTFTNLGSHTMICGPGDQAPTVASTVPANNGTAQKTDNIVITFSEPVTVVEPWFSIVCGTSGTHTAVVTDADPVFTLNPDDVFTVGETCTVTIDHTKVNDDDLDDAIADYMLADYVFSFGIAPGCGDPFTPIYDIQGAGETSPLVNQNVTTEGVVVGDFQVGGKNGYYIQDIAGDGNPATSDGIFVYNTTTAVNVGDHVRVSGKAVEYYGITEISPVTQVLICSSGHTIIPTPVTLPVTAVSDFEKYESMLVTFPQPLIISEYFNFDRYGEIVLTSTRHMTPTALVEPGTPAQAEAAAYLLDRITLDDGRTTQNPDPAIHPNGLTFTMENLFRGGGTVTSVTGILDFYQGLYRIQPTIGAIYEDANPRTEAPEIIEADLKVTSFNVLNYFVTLDDGTNDICGPSGTMECRGADDAEEFERQKAKILAALDAIDSDIYGLMEIENDSPFSGNDAVADLVAGLNAIKGEGTYAYIDTGAIGTDAIKQAILYKPALVTPVGAYQILDSSVDARFIDTLNRPVLAQVFVDNEGGVPFVVAVNHLKSKGSACVDDPDPGDGQGNCNLTRLAAAQAMVDWLANPAYFPELGKVLIIGDLNSYDKEDPIDAIKLGADDTADTADDYLDMIFEKRGENAYGYVYDGQTGYLDHALANHAMADSIVDVNFWHINADEPDLIDYDTSFKLPAQDALYAPDAYRSSDHDPVIVTLSFNAVPFAENQEVTTAEDTSKEITLVATDADGDTLEYLIVDEPLHGEVVLVDNVATYTPALDYNGTDSFTFTVNDGTVDSNIATVTITITPLNDAPVALEDVYITDEDTALTVLVAEGVLVNDTDVDGDELTAILVSDVNNGSLDLAEDGSFVYTPAENYFGTDSFTYKVSDGTLESNTVTVSITINPVNDWVTANDDEYETMAGVTLEVEAPGVLANDELLDPNETVTLEVLVEPTGGTLTLNDDGSFTYVPNGSFFGVDTFEYQLNSTSMLQGEFSDTAVVTIKVTAKQIFLPLILR